MSSTTPRASPHANSLVIGTAGVNTHTHTPHRLDDAQTAPRQSLRASGGSRNQETPYSEVQRSRSLWRPAVVALAPPMHAPGRVSLATLKFRTFVHSGSAPRHLRLRLVRDGDGQTSPHKPRLVVSRSTCQTVIHYPPPPMRTAL
jgi:hypothetical protein